MRRDDVETPSPSPIRPVGRRPHRKHHDAAVIGATNGLALNEAALIALIKPEDVTKAAGSASGSVDLSFSAASTAFDYLAQGEVLTLTYTVAIDDGDGGVTPEDFRRHRYRHQRRAVDREVRVDPRRADR